MLKRAIRTFYSQGEWRQNHADIKQSWELLKWAIMIFFSHRKWRQNRNQKDFVVDFKIADGKFKNLNQNFNRLLLALGEENEKAQFAIEASFVPVILIFGKNIVLELPYLSWIYHLSVWKEINNFGIMVTHRTAAIFKMLK